MTRIEKARALFKEWGSIAGVRVVDNSDDPSFVNYPMHVWVISTFVDNTLPVLSARLAILPEMLDRAVDPDAYVRMEWDRMIRKLWYERVRLTAKGA